MKYLAFIPLSLSIALVILAIPVQATPRTCDVIKVNDGDTIKVSCSGTIERVRFCGVDAPEIKHGNKPAQPYGKEATDLVKQLLKGGKVEVSRTGSDRYGRTVAELFLGNTFINAEVVRQGYAYEYKQYSQGCPHREQIRQAEDRAKANKVGVWDGGNYQFPWDFRKSNR
ncbi:micrococcal nuclease-like nuclease [Synechococcus sp. PCC 7502]|uniref:thermonuclease family protein n=1 Tax=Synechococcus sp. PCC 7502 TaxID=1173263 RepID=UPI00029FD829|nr:thermonuclease family protein [Synechococcus sp. PCC 7502]AFY74794.1 micrococcal nuclease-like nuclease [Synechococcus sp. PCC 7502]